jgi:hypothetical protein
MTRKRKIAVVAICASLLVGWFCSLGVSYVDTWNYVDDGSRKDTCDIALLIWPDSDSSVTMFGISWSRCLPSTQIILFRDSAQGDAATAQPFVVKSTRAKYSGSENWTLLATDIPSQESTYSRTQGTAGGAYEFVAVTRHSVTLKENISSHVKITEIEFEISDNSGASCKAVRRYQVLRNWGIYPTIYYLSRL